ncbi:glycosyltransferase family 2 protein [Paenibacillus sp. GCM10027627]|uniref:glycosyltransferase family 2 protein n=1 Tax=unclassified Paenibacillus TaxID=185978 RepID=UPI00362C9506
MHTNCKKSVQVSVIIPTLNAGISIKDLCSKLWNQTHSPHEIIVIDSESKDDTAVWAREAGARIISINRYEFDHGGTRNRAASTATGEILLFMTQDAIPYNEKLIEELIKPLTDLGDESNDSCRYDDVIMSYARQLARSDASIPEKLAREHNYPPASRIQSIDQLEKLGIKTFFCSNVCSAIRKKSFESMGRFQEPVIFNEDLFMSAKCILGGKKVAYCAEAMVTHSHDYTAMQQFKRYFDNGVSMRLNAWITPYSSVGNAGSQLVRSQLKGLYANGRWYMIPKLIVESAAKLFGYKLGLHHRRLPKFFIKRISMHPLIWGQLNGRSETITIPNQTNTLDQ